MPVRATNVERERKPHLLEERRREMASKFILRAVCEA